MKINKNLVSKKILDLFEIPNPKYMDLLKLGKSTRWCKDTKSLIFNDLLPPSALYWSALEGKKINNERPFKTKIDIKDLITLRADQEKPYNDLLKCRVALLEASTVSLEKVVPDAV